MLLTRSPLSTRASPGFSFDLHVLGAPPAFVLSQDQTLHRDFNPTNTQVEHEIGELPFRVTSAPFRQLCTTAPEGVSPCGIDGDVSHDTPALAFGVTVPFSRSHHSTPARLATVKSRNRPDSAEPTLNPASTTPAGSGVCRSVRVNPPGNRSPGGLEILRPGPALCKPERPISRRDRTLVSPPMGSSGTKKTRKGKPRQHLAKVGTPAENSHTQHAAERDVVGNFGVHGKGWHVLGRRRGARRHRRRLAARLDLLVLGPDP